MLGAGDTAENKTGTIPSLKTSKAQRHRKYKKKVVLGFETRTPSVGP